MTENDGVLGIGTSIDLVVVDCSDPLALGGFYGALLGWQIVKDGEDGEDGEDADEWVTVRNPAGHGVGLAFQLSPGFEPPTWAGAEHSGENSDGRSDVADLDAEEARAVELGARLVKDNDRKPRGYRVHADPAEHFFCPCA